MRQTKRQGKAVHQSHRTNGQNRCVCRRSFSSPGGLKHHQTVTGHGKTKPKMEKAAAPDDDLAKVVAKLRSQLEAKKLDLERLSQEIERWTTVLGGITEIFEL